MGGIPQESALGPLLFLIYVNDMPLQIRNGSLLQFADDTCLICCGHNHTQVKDSLCSDLGSLVRWIATSKMQVNVKKSSVLWFSVKSCKSSTVVPPILLQGTPLENVDKQKYLGITIDSNLTWASHVANVCKKMAYYLYLIGCHQKVLPNSIIKMLIDSLMISHFMYGLPVWGPSLTCQFASPYYSFT